MHQSSNRYSSSCLRAARVTLGFWVATCFFSPAWVGAADAPIVIRGSKNLQPVVVQWADGYAQTAKAPPLDIVATGLTAQEMIVETGFYPAQQADTVSNVKQ